MYQTRHSQDLRLPFPHLNIHKQSVINNWLKYIGTGLVNQLGVHLLSCHLKGD